MPKMRVKIFPPVVLIGFACVICLTSCLGRTTVKAQAVSPGGQYRAELREGDTGAVGGWISAVRVSEVSPSLWTRLLGREGSAVFGADFRTTLINLTWKSDTNLQITCKACSASKIQLQKDAWRGVTISYDMRQTDPSRE